MSDSLLMLLEMIEEEIFPSMKNITPVAQSNDDIGYMKSKGTKKEVKAGVLDVKRIVDAIVSTTESETADKDQGIGDSFKIIRSFNQGKVDNIDSAQTLNDAIISFYQNTSDQLQPDCRDFSTIAKRALINAAYSKILNDFNASAAGFVNEAYLANLIGEDARTIEAGKNKIDGGAGNSFNDISDLEFKNMGISLKTKLKGVKGSLRDLMATLGIPFKIKGGRENTRLSSNKYPLHPGGLYYVFFGKDQSAQNYFDISTALITKESLIKYLRSQGVRFRKAPDGLSYAYMNSKLVEKIEKDRGGILGAGKIYAKMGDIGGIADFANERLEFKPNEEFNKQQAEKLGEELTTTLNTLNSYISEIEKTIVQYAASPTVGNLTTLQKSLQILSDFQIASLMSC